MSWLQFAPLPLHRFRVLTPLSAPLLFAPQLPTDVDVEGMVRRTQTTNGQAPGDVSARMGSVKDGSRNSASSFGSSYGSSKW